MKFVTYWCRQKYQLKPSNLWPNGLKRTIYDPKPIDYEGEKGKPNRSTGSLLNSWLTIANIA